MTSAADQRADKVSGDLWRGDHGSMQGAVDQLRGVVQDDPQQALNIIRRVNCESQGAPASLVIQDDVVFVHNAVTNETAAVGRLGGDSWTPYEQSPQPLGQVVGQAESPPRPSEPVTLNDDDYSRADKVSADLRRGDTGSMQGAVTELAGMVQDDPNRARALIRQIHLESYGAPARVIRHGHRVEIVNVVTQQRMDVGWLGSGGK